MALFTSARDASLIRSINREIINNIISDVKTGIEEVKGKIQDAKEDIKQDIKEKTLLLCDGSGENKSHNFIKKCKEYGIKL